MVLKEDFDDEEYKVDENGVLYTDEINIENDEYNGRDDIVKLVAPNCKTIEECAFYGCHNLKEVDLPQCEWVDDGVFENCVSLKDVKLPRCKYIGGCVFWYCRSLRNIDIPDDAEIIYGTFKGTSFTKLENSPGYM